MNKLLLYSALLLLTQCSKCKKDDPAPLDQLPPATQPGANTFGCLVNGQAWTPKGYNGTLNLNVYYDRTYHGGNFGINTYRINEKTTQYIVLGGDSIANIGMYSLVSGPRTVFFSDGTKPSACQDSDGKSSRYCRGVLTLTRLDRQAGVVSGTFWFTLYKPGCDSLRVTNGRFDRKL